jgi:two-component system CheB/CheR fusion protein
MKAPYIVGIGASAGGLDAIQQLFDHCSNHTNLAFVVVQHLSPDFKSLMPELLAKHTKMEIFTAEDKLEIKPNCIYLNQRNKNLHIKGNRLYLLDKGPKHNLNLPIDIFFHTLGEEHKERSVGVILSGTGSDGSRGIKSIKEGGGTVIVQDPESAQFDGMPNSAISTNLTDFILPPKEIAGILEKIPGQRLRLDAENADTSQKSNDQIYHQILKEIHTETNIDFRLYKRNTLLRRLEKRMNVNNIVNLLDYLDFLRSHREEIEVLKQDFLIGVTSFFRDKSAFDAIKNKVVPEIVASKNPGEPIRIWAAGCSTGEEVYSLAMLFDDFIRSNRLNVDFKIFATDIDGTAITKASLGLFHVNILNEVPKEYLEEYFVKQGDRLQIIKRIRDRIVFSKHNLSQDPPFITIDLVTCRNLLIYLNNQLQEKVYQDFLFSLNHHGFLFLGSSESLGESSKFFEEMDARHKIFRSVITSKQVPRRLRDDKFPTTATRRIQESFASDVHYRYKENPDDSYYRFLSKRFSPSSVFIDKDYNILFIKGDAGQLIQHGEGAFKNNLLEMVSPELGAIIRNGIRKVDQDGKDTRVEKVILDKGNQEVSLDLTVCKLDPREGISGAYMIHFGNETVPKEEVNVIKNIPMDEVSQQRLSDLEDELKSAKTELQNVVEELETSNEELQSSNEELMASNEELQSTNEELQSVNEELYTVNSVLQEKNQELVGLNNDISNLFESTEIGTLFLDRDLKIRKFTKPLMHHFSLTIGDLGRPIYSFSSSFGEQVKNLILEHSKETLNSLKSFELEVQDVDENYFLCRISPFVTLDKKIDGVIITFVNISELKSKEQALEHSHTELIKAQEIAHLGSWTLDMKSGEVSWTLELFKMFGLDPSGGAPSYEEQEKYFTEDSWMLLSQTLEHSMATGEPYELELELKKHTGEMAWLVAKGAAECNDQGEVVAWRGIAQDITQKKSLSEELLAEKQFSERISELSPAGIYVVNMAEDRFEYLNDQCCEILGYSREELSGLGLKDIFSKVQKDHPNTWEANFAQATPEEEKSSVDFQYQRQDGSIIWCHLIRCPFERARSGAVLSYLGVIADITDEKLAETKLKESMHAAKAASIYKDQFLANMSHEIRTPLNGLVGFADLLRDDDLEAEDRNSYLDLIKGCSDQLLNLIDDILDLSKIEAGELKMDNKECSPFSIIQSSLETFNKIKEEKNKEHIHFTINVPSEEKELLMMSDPLRLQQVLSNLLNNALKFSDDGTIEFGYRLDRNEIVFYVKDEGIGISEERIVQIFERFEHLEDAIKKYEGTGLGLSLSKGIIELLGGTLSVETQIGEGSTFTFRVPYTPADTPKNVVSTSQNVEANSIRGLRILIVEDEKVNQVYFRALFKKLGIDYQMAENGKEAVAILRANSNFDVILMDIRMPIMDGETAAKEILKFNKDAKIIAQTANAMSDDQKKYLDMGFTDYISKPIDVELFQQKLMAIMQA